MDKKLIELNGCFKYIIYQSDNGYTVAEFEGDESIVCVGYLSDISLDTPYLIRGYLNNHSKYGEQFSIEYIEKQIPNEKEQVIKYLSSPLFKGIGRKVAEKIVEKLGEDAIKILCDNNALVYDLPITKTQAANLLEGLNNDFDKTTLFLSKFGLNNHQIQAIKQKYGDKSVEIIEEDPYRLVFEIDGIGFKTAEKLAEYLEEDNEKSKLKALIYTKTIDNCMKSGDTCLIVDEFIEEIVKLGFEEIKIRGSIDQLVSEHYLSLYQNKYLYHDSQYLSEQGIADFIKSFKEQPVQTLTNDLDAMINSIEILDHITFSDLQKEAMKEVFNHNITIITGGPGTGKTTILKAITRLYQQLYPEDKIALCAPTGRASKRISEVCNCNANTIHSLLKWNLEENAFNMNADHPIEEKFLIIDEFSMVDNYLFYNLLLASKNVTKILLVGDEQQLPSVSPGNVLHDLIASKQVPYLKLVDIYRQKAGNGIIDLAKDIADGKMITTLNSDNAKLFPVNDFEMVDQIVNVYKDALNKGYSDLDIQVLAPIYKGSNGIDEINKRLQDIVNPLTDNKNSIAVGKHQFREGDKILQLKNQADDFVFNGDIGRIVSIEPELIIADFDGNEVEYAKEDFNNITLAYCTSIHKSQGSEYKIVILALASKHHFMLYKKLIYTAITRAKNSLVILGKYQVLNDALHHDNQHKRITNLKTMLETK